MIEYKKGNIFHSDCEALVNPVNCFGVMGKGLAADFKNHFPDNHGEYLRACDKKKIRAGVLLPFEEQGRWIINFPTKRHWKNPSLIEDIRAGLESLKTLLIDKRITSIAMPALGCGLGGLRWKDVKRLIEDSFFGWPNNIKIEVYEPWGKG